MTYERKSPKGLGEKCGAKTRSGGSCQKPPAQGRNRCKLHGGATPTGIAHYNWQGGKSMGRVAPSAPNRMINAIEAADKDPQLQSLRNDIILTDARIIDLLARADQGGAGAIFEELVTLWRDYLATPFPANLAVRDQVTDCINRGFEDYVIWEEIRANQDHKRKMVESEVKMMNIMQTMIPAERALSVMRSLLRIIGEVVTDRDQLAEISRRASYLQTQL